ncbi:MAG: glycoside hydrolase family 88 protein [Muribaculaceae bacterium]|nr:glycoside hydrolase family 88 protein [Muribaculaceae bacterium]
MKKTILSLLLVALSVPCISGAESLPPRKKTLETLVKVNDHYFRNHPDPSTSIPYYSRKKVYEANLWTRAVYYEGLMALYNIYTKVKSTMNMLVNTPQVNDWTWIDAIQMGMPALAKLGNVTGERKYYEKAHDMYVWTRDSLAGGLYNRKEGLWWRDKDFVPPYKEPNGKNCYWSRGNGWVVAALARVLEESPADDPYRQEYINDFKALCEALVKCQRKDGFWDVSLHDPSNFGGKETTGTALFVYGMAWGINNGILYKAKYLPVVTKAWNAIVNDAIHENGYIGYVQGTGKEPKDGQPVAYDSRPDFDDYGTGCVLLAGSEVYKLK